MNKPIHQQVEEAYVPASMISRHPRVQRPSPLSRFFKKCGPYDSSKNVNPVHLVSDGNGAYHAIDGATRVEACKATKGYGPDTMIQAKIYGNGKQPNDKELAQLFLTTNVQRVGMNARTEYKQALTAGDKDAIAAEGLAEKLGSAFNARPGLRNLIKKTGKKAVGAAVDEASSIWNTPGSNIPLAFIKAIMAIQKDGATDRLRRRRSALRKKGTHELYQAAQLAQYRMTGRRPTVGELLVKILLGVRTQ